LTSPAVQFDQLDSVPLAVIRRQTSASELSRVVPQCCGLVWNAVRAQQARAGRHVAIYWDGSIRLEVGVELYGPFAEEGEVVRSATPAGPVGMDNASRALQRPGRCAQCSSPVVSCQPSTTCGSKLGDIRPLAKRVEYKSIGDPNRCLLPADLLRPARYGRVAQFESGVTSVASGERQKTWRAPEAWRSARYMTPRP
jgi:hypothetical protein